MRKILCLLGFHSYKTVDMTDAFFTTRSDRPDAPPIHHILWYQECACGKRRLKDTYKNDTYNLTMRQHRGIEYARVGWEVYGKMSHVDHKEVSKPTPPPVKRRKPHPHIKLVKGD